MTEPQSPCPMLNALFIEGRLRPSARGTVTLKELGDAMRGAGLDPSQLIALRAIAALGSDGIDGLVGSSFGTDDQYPVDLTFHLLDGVLGHAADSGVLGDPPGPRAERFAELIAFAEERPRAGGGVTRVMTQASYLRALDARANAARAHEGSATKGRFFGALEAQLIPSLFGELTVEQLHALYFQGKIPPASPNQASLGALLPQILRRLPTAFADDFRRAMAGKTA